MKRFVCAKCGHEVYSSTKPDQIKWTDGHRCVFGEKPMPEKPMETRIELMALRTWDAIGGDCLRCAEEFSGKSTMSRAEVVEAVCDAGYMKMYGDDQEAYDHWYNLSFEEQEKAVEKAFTYETYGW